MDRKTRSSRHFNRVPVVRHSRLFVADVLRLSQKLLMGALLECLAIRIEFIRTQKFLSPPATAGGPRFTSWIPASAGMTSRETSLGQTLSICHDKRTGYSGIPA